MFGETINSNSTFVNFRHHALSKTTLRLNLWLLIVITLVTFAAFTIASPTINDDDKDLATTFEIMNDAANTLTNITENSNLFAVKKHLLHLEERQIPASKLFVAKFLTLDANKQKEVNQFKNAWHDRIFEQYKRLHSIGRLDGLSAFFPISVFDEANVSIAASQITGIDSDVQTAKIVHSVIPARLSVLTLPLNGFPASITTDRLKDPWGREYQYDYLGPRNGGKKPDVWSLGPLHKGTGSGLVGNWPKE